MSVGDRWLAERGVTTREMRDPTAATQQLRYIGAGMAQVDEWNAERAIRFGYHANIVAYRCITLIANTIAARRFRAGGAPPERPGDTADHNPAARLARLLGPPPGGPNVETSARKLWAWSIAQKLSTGRYGWEIETEQGGGKGPVVALWPLVSANLKAVPSERGSRYFSAFEYGRPDQLKTLAPEQVHYGWEASLSDWRQPFSPLQVARYELSVALAADQHTYSFLKNNAVPATIVGVEAFESAEQFEAWKRQWNSTYQGPENDGKVHFTEIDPGDGDAKLSEALFVQTIGTSAKDSRLTETHQKALERIAITLGVPWSKLDASGRTFDNASEEDRTLWESTLLGVAADFEDDVNMRLAPRLGSEVGWFDLSDVEALQPRVPATAQEIPALIMAGVCSAEEARPWLGLTGSAPSTPALPEIPALPTPAEEVEPNGTPDDVQRAAHREGSRAGGAAGRGGQEARTEEARRQEAEARATVDQEKRRGAIWRATDAVIVGMERDWERRFRKLFGRQQKAVIARLEGRSRAKHWTEMAAANNGTEARARADDLFDPAFWLVETEVEATSLFEQLSSSAFARLSASFGVSFDLESEFAQLFIRSRSNQLAGQVTDTTYRSIVDAMAEGVGAGEGIPQLAARIRAVFSDAGTRRAVMIARTEVLSGHNAAFVAGFTTLPTDVAAGMVWIATRDGRTRPTHQTADGQVVFIGQAFSVAGIGCAYPGDPSLPAKETVNCRCTLAGLTPAELEEAAAVYADAQAAATAVVPIGRARVALALVVAGKFDEVRFRRALEIAA